MVAFQHFILLFFVLCINSCWGIFQEVQEAGERNWQGVATSSNGKQQAAVVLGGGIWLSSDSGNTWNEHDNVNTTAQPWKAITSSSSGQILMAANFDTGIWVSTNYGHVWNMTEDSSRFQDIACSETCQYAVAVINNGFIYTSNDYGQNWNDANNAGYRFWEAVASDSTGQYLIAILNDYIYTSNNFGNVWNPTNKKGIWKDCASDSSGKYLAIVENGGYIYTSNDYGGTWQSNDSPNEYWYSIASSSSGQLLFAGADGVDIYASDDYGSTWYQTNAGAQKWWSLATDEDGEMAVAGAYGEYLYVTTNPTATEKAASCFAADSMLTLRNETQLSMSEIKVGDEILSVNRYGESSFSTVVAIPHGPNTQEAIFVHFFTEKGRDLKISLDHLIMYSPSCSTDNISLQKASSLNNGGCVLDGTYELDTITTIEITKYKGVYTVVTTEEYIVVNDLIASPFAVSHVIGNFFYDFTYRLLFRDFKLLLSETSLVVSTFLDFVTDMSDIFV